MNDNTFTNILLRLMNTDITATDASSIICIHRSYLVTTRIVNEDGQNREGWPLFLPINQLKQRIIGTRYVHSGTTSFYLATQ